ncbi:MAG: glycosyltransferase, partial [Acidobacteria bacterium]|nr:glycosyltransferase [Acidobacteriota bacterium]
RVPRYAALAERLKVAAHVRFAGAVDRATLADMYRASNLLMHPSFYDPFPRAIVETLACGVPVATTAACGAAEIITQGETGFVMNDPRDISTWVGVIETMADPQRRAAMREAAATTGRQFDFNTHAAEVAAWLEAS